MSLPARLGIALGAFVIVVLLVVAGKVSSRTESERERFVGQPCRESPPESIPAAALVPSAPAADGVASSETLPAPSRAIGGEQPMSGAGAALAKRYEPILNVAKADRFWPVSVPAVLDLRLGERFTRFSSPTRFSDHAQLSDLVPRGGASQYLDYPAEIDRVQDQFCSVGGALHIPVADLAQWSTNPDLLEPGRSAQFYFLDRPAREGGRDLQYWFFYPLNYLPALTDDFVFTRDPIAAIRANADFHEGDFEQVTVQLRPRGGAVEPVAVKMSRHEDEDRTLAWGSPELQLVEGHPVVYAGFGGHASYDRCGVQLRRVHGVIPLLDWTLCGDARNFIFGPETPLVDLRSVPWACWPGHFGELPPHPVAQLFVTGPRSPFFQKDDRDLTAELCPDDRGR